VSERGSASIAVLGVGAVILLLAGTLAGIGAFLRATAEAEAAADAAALAAAPVTFLPFGAKGTPAEEAARFAELNGSRLVWCRCPIDPSWEPRTVEVETVRLITIWPFGSFEVRATSRAEFVPSLLLG
jgi:secretion/DNA translocation related TadE-like protein